MTTDPNLRHLFKVLLSDIRIQQEIAHEEWLYEQHHGADEDFLPVPEDFHPEGCQCEDCSPCDWGDGAALHHPAACACDICEDVRVPC